MLPYRSTEDKDLIQDERSKFHSGDGPFHGTLASILQCQACGCQNPIRSGLAVKWELID